MGSLFFSVHGARRVVVRATVVLAGLAVLTATPAIAADVEPSQSVTPMATVAQIEADMLRLTNEVRSKGRYCGATWYPAAPPVKSDLRLVTAARKHSQDMGVRNLYDNDPNTPWPHITPEGTTPGSRVTAEGFKWTAVGENVHAWWPDAQGAMYGAVINGTKYNGWLDSSGHCANIMNPTYTYVGNGFASVPGSTWVNYFTQEFAKPQAGMVFAPDAPTITSTTAVDGSATINFTPGATGGAAITNYLYSIDGGATWKGLSPADNTSPLTIGGLTNGVTYRIQIAAINGSFFTVGASPGSNIVSVTPKSTRMVPTAPTITSVTPADGKVWVAFTPGSDGGLPIRTYDYSIDGGATWITLNPAQTTSPLQITGLANGVERNIAIRARNDLGAGPAPTPIATTPKAPVASVYVPIAPVRVFDSRPTSGGTSIASGETRRISVADQITTAGGAKNVVPTGAVAIAYNITYPGGPASGHFRVMPGDVAASNASALNFLAGRSIANGTVVKIDTARTIRIYNATGATQNAIIDVVGYFVPAASNPTGGKFTPTTPTRVYDSTKPLASGQAADGSLASLQTREINVTQALATGARLVPSGATGLAYNITVIDPRGAGHLRVFPGDQAEPPMASVLNFADGDRVANGTIVKLSPTGTIRVYNGAGAPVDFFIDVAGYYRSDSGAAFYPGDPFRVYDSRAPQPAPGTMSAGEPSRVISVTDSRDANGAVIARSLVPTDTTAIAYNLGVTNTGSAGNLEFYAAGQPLPNGTVIHWPGAGHTRANASMVGVSADQKVAVYSSVAGPHVFLDVLGYYR